MDHETDYLWFALTVLLLLPWSNTLLPSYRERIESVKSFTSPVNKSFVAQESVTMLFLGEFEFMRNPESDFFSLIG